MSLYPPAPLCLFTDTFTQRVFSLAVASLASLSFLTHWKLALSLVLHPSQAGLDAHRPAGSIF